VTPANHSNAPGWLGLMNISRKPLGEVDMGEGRKPHTPSRTHSIHRRPRIRREPSWKRSLTMGPGLPDPQGLHWLLTGEFLFAVETGAADYTS